MKQWVVSALVFILILTAAVLLAMFPAFRVILFFVTVSVVVVAAIKEIIYGNG